MSKFGVFIIESLRQNDYLDGLTLRDILDLSDIEVEYEDVQNEECLIEALEKFNTSNFRYLHLSCHANSTGIEIGGIEITNERLSNIIGNTLTKKRLFMSACQGSNIDIASKIISKNKAYSLIGTPEDLRFDKSVLFWPTFYHVINEIDSSKMGFVSIKQILIKCVNLLNITIDFYSFIRKDKNKMRVTKLRKDSSTKTKIISLDHT